MNIFESAMEQNKLIAENSAMALEAQLKTAEEARTANLIAAYDAIGGMGSDWAMQERQKLRELIWKRLEL